MGNIQLDDGMVSCRSQRSLQRDKLRSEPQWWDGGAVMTAGGVVRYFRESSVVHTASWEEHQRTEI